MVSNATQISTVTESPLTLKLRASDAAEPDYIAQLEKNGFAVVPGVLPVAKAAEYVDRANSWLEDFNFGFKRDDRETW